MTRTNVHTLLCVLIRAFAAYGVVVVGLRVLAQLFGPPGDWSLWLRIAFYVAALLPLVLMWIFPDWLAKAAVARKTGEVFESDLDARQLLGVALAAGGAFIVIDALISVANYLFLALYYAHPDAQEIHGSFGHDHWVGMATTGAALVLGSALFLGSRGLAALAFRFRYGDFDPRT